MSPALAGGFFTTSATSETRRSLTITYIITAESEIPPHLVFAISSTCNAFLLDITVAYFSLTCWRSPSQQGLLWFYPIFNWIPVPFSKPENHCPFPCFIFLLHTHLPSLFSMYFISLNYPIHYIFLLLECNFYNCRG